MLNQHRFLMNCGHLIKFGSHNLYFYILGQRPRPRSTSSVSAASKISVQHMQQILEMLKCNQNRDSTKVNYVSIWHQFNSFVLKLDKTPSTWEGCVSLYGAFLVDQGIQSSTLQSYVSAIKSILVIDGYDWQDKKVLLNILVKACKLKNDVMYI